MNDTKSDLRQDDWYRVASGKGVLLLHGLRTRLGAEKFDALMEQFGKEHGGKPTSAAEFETFIVENTGPDSKDVSALLDGCARRRGCRVSNMAALPPSRRSIRPPGSDTG